MWSDKFLKHWDLEGRSDQSFWAWCSSTMSYNQNKRMIFLIYLTPLNGLCHLETELSSYTLVKAVLVFGWLSMAIILPQRRVWITVLSSPDELILMLQKQEGKWWDLHGFELLEYNLQRVLVHYWRAELSQEMPVLILVQYVAVCVVCSIFNPLRLMTGLRYDGNRRLLSHLCSCGWEGSYITVNIIV